MNEDVLLKFAVLKRNLFIVEGMIEEEKDKWIEERISALTKINNILEVTRDNIEDLEGTLRSEEAV